MSKSVVKFFMYLMFVMGVLNLGLLGMSILAGKYQHVLWFNLLAGVYAFYSSSNARDTLKQLEQPKDENNV